MPLSKDGNVKGLEPKSGNMVTRGQRGDRGFSLIEAIMVVAVIVTISSIAIIRLEPYLQQSQANAGLDQVKTVLRQARETAISQRRTIIVKFVSAVASTPCPTAANISNCVELFQMVVSGTPPTQTQAANPYVTVPIESNIKFLTYSGEVDTPDGFGISGATGGIEFGGVGGGPGSGMQFQSDGTFTDGSGNLINGTVFLGANNMPASAQAVTVMGGTGRIRAYHGTGAGWWN
jgi:prepilin-type N-terminal cleavage/methylation domain-containing protein